MRTYKTDQELRDLTDKLWEAGYHVELSDPDIQMLTQYAKQRIEANHKSNIAAGRTRDLQNLQKRQTVGLIGEYAVAKYIYGLGIKYNWDGSYNENNADIQLIRPDGTTGDMGIKTLVYDPDGKWVNTFQIRTAESVNRPHIPQCFVMIKAPHKTIWLPVPKVEIRFCGTLTPEVLYAKDANNDYFHLDASRTAWGATGKAGFTGVEVLIHNLTKK